jgi:predicted nuclease of predicted toxin-antitoxin system
VSAPLLANENWPRPALSALRAAGLDIQAVAERMPGASDAEVLRHAAAQGRWVLTFDRDYGELVFARSVPPPPAIVYLRQGAYAPDWPARVVLDLLLRVDWVSGHLVVVDGRSVRRRALPLAA